MAAATTPSNTISSSLLFPSKPHLRVSSQILAFPRRRGFSGVRAAQVNPSGSIDASSRRSMAEKEELNADVVTVKDAYGDGRHVSIYVVSSAFEGQSEVKRQRMVYKAIWEEIQTTVHAVDEMITYTQAEIPENK